MIYKIKGKFLEAVRLAWTVKDDFTPKQTIDEIALFINDWRKDMFDSPFEDLRARLEAKLQASQIVHSSLAINGSSKEMVDQLNENSSMLDAILAPQNLYKDVFAGTHSPEGNPGKEWQRAGEHPTSINYFKDRVKGVLSRVFEDRDLADEEIIMRTKLNLHKQVLNQVREIVKPESHSSIDKKLNALKFATDAVNTAKTATLAKVAKNRNRDNIKKVPSDNSKRQEIPIQ